MKKDINTLRKLNIIKRAVIDFGLEFDSNDEIENVYNDAWNMIYDKANTDYFDECERNSSYTHIYWQDKNGYVCEDDGEFISTYDRHNKYYRKDEKGNFTEIPWFEHTEDDYILMDWVIDSDGLVVALVCK